MHRAGISESCWIASILDRDAFDTADNDVINGLIHLNMSYNDSLLGYSGIAMMGDLNWRETVPRDAEQLRYITYGSNCTRVPLSSDATHLAGGALDQVVSYEGEWFASASLTDLVYVSRWSQVRGLSSIRRMKTSNLWMSPTSLATMPRWSSACTSAKIAS